MMRRLEAILRLLSLSMVVAIMTTACDDFDAEPVEFDQTDIVELGDVQTLELRGHVLTSLPKQPLAAVQASAELGRLLFWDPVLSAERDVACATCHLPEHAYTDALAQSIGVGGVGRGSERIAGSSGHVSRNAQTLLNTGWNGINSLGVFNPATAPMFWDNRTAGLSAQAAEPIESREEMRGDTVSQEAIRGEIESRLADIDEYKLAFARAYGDSETSFARVTDALASFQRTLVANNAPFDRWMRGESGSMTPQQLSGMQEFVIAGCAECHSGPLFSDFEPHVLGVSEGNTGDTPDTGNGSFAFRTPTLRQLAFTAPYFHAGQRATLASVMDFYDEPRQSRNPHVASNQLAPELLAVPEMDDGRGARIQLFLNALNDDKFDRQVPESVPSGLPVGGSLQ